MNAQLFRKGTILRRGLSGQTAGGLVAIGIATSLGCIVAGSGRHASAAGAPATPIQHLVVIYGENISYDHYFGTYPNATNVAGEPSFNAQPGTPTSNNYLSNPSLLTSNPNLNPANGTGATNPFRLDRTQAVSGDQGHSYTPEQNAFDNFKMDLFPKNVGNGTSGGAGAFGTTALNLGYFDGNTVTGLWNYAQGFSMSDNSFSDQFGPSTPGALNAVSGQTNGMVITHGTSTSYWVNDGQGGKTEINDADPSFDICSIAANGNEINFPAVKHVGDLLNTAGVTWGSFMGGFNLSLVNPNGTTGCGRTSANVSGATTGDYIQHHAWFQYFASALNANHTRPTSTAAIGTNSDAANHEYDLQDFYTAVSAGNFPAVSYIKMPAYQDGHAGYSDPLDEQQGVVALINFLQQQPGWSNTAVIIAYDDSDGWYDHVFTTITSPSFDPTADTLNGPGTCGTGTAQNGVSGKPVNGRCGPGPRQPFMMISPWAKPNYISHVLITQASIVKFIEDNWLSGQRLGGGSFDANAGSIMDLFNFTSTGGSTPRRFLHPVTGNPFPSLSHDFYNSGFSGVAWRDTSGNVGLWKMNGTTVLSSAIPGNMPTTWSIIGQATLNNSGAADLIWRDQTGNVGIWFMNGSQIVSTATLGVVPTQWTLVGIAPFSGTGAELFWRDTSGNVGTWVLNGTQVVSTSILGNVPTVWTVAGTGDFNGDGYTDILWRDASGNVGIWLMNGTKVASTAVLGNVTNNWTIVGTGDFNGDGNTDILWRDTAGNVGIWLMNGTAIASTSVLGNVPNVWTVTVTGDFNGDGKSDILWRDATGNAGMWLMNGTQVTTSAVLGNVPATWTVQTLNAD